MVLFRNSCLYLLKYLQRSDSQALKFHRSIKFQKLLGNITGLSTLWTAWSGIFFKNRDYHHQHFLQRQYKQVESRNYISTKHSPSNWTELSFMKTSVHLLIFFHYFETIQTLTGDSIWELLCIPALTSFKTATIWHLKNHYYKTFRTQGQEVFPL